MTGGCDGRALRRPRGAAHASRGQGPRVPERQRRPRGLVGCGGGAGVSVCRSPLGEWRDAAPAGRYSAKAIEVRPGDTESHRHWSQPGSGSGCSRLLDWFRAGWRSAARAPWLHGIVRRPGLRAPMLRWSGVWPGALGTRLGVWPAVPSFGRSGLIPAPGTAGHTPVPVEPRPPVAVVGSVPRAVRVGVRDVGVWGAGRDLGQFRFAADGNCPRSPPGRRCQRAPLPPPCRVGGDVRFREVPIPGGGCPVSGGRCRSVCWEDIAGQRPRSGAGPSPGMPQGRHPWWVLALRSVDVLLAGTRCGCRPAVPP